MMHAAAKMVRHFRFSTAEFIKIIELSKSHHPICNDYSQRNMLSKRRKDAAIQLLIRPRNPQGDLRRRAAEPRHGQVKSFTRVKPTNASIKIRPIPNAQRRIWLRMGLPEIASQAIKARWPPSRTGIGSS